MAILARCTRPDSSTTNSLQPASTAEWTVTMGDNADGFFYEGIGSLDIVAFGQFEQVAARDKEIAVEIETYLSVYLSL